jgi:DNA-binding winged helix-turn-helix (wHTH) protein/Tol biopolymer transport system component
VSSRVPSPEVSPASSRGPARVYEFGEFRLDGGRFELLRDGRALRVEPKPMELLILLVARQGQMVTRAEIAERLWSSDVFVDTEHGINTAIRKLRHLLHDDPDDPHFIQTVTGMGYRFVAPVATVAPVLQDRAAAVPAVAPESGVAARRRMAGWYVGLGACVTLAIGGGALYRMRHRPPEIRYTQLTDFTDSAVAPALSPDGRMVAFVRGGDAFLTSDKIYVKMLPHGEARRVTDDSRPKYGLAFSPDGSEIAYTVLEPSGFSTYEVSVLGGEPHLLLKNAGGLVWLDPQRVLFSEMRGGIHMGVVTSTVTGGARRDIYFPAHERGMAHYSYPSPDRRWALVVEMSGNGDWAPCRLVGLEGQGAAKLVGPAGACISAGWSTDGAWMYFSAVVEGRSHLWRQRFPEGAPEQITFGPAEEGGVAVEPAGRALITSVGVHQTAVWIHDGGGDRQLSSEGEVEWSISPLSFSPDDSAIYYLLRRGEGSSAELWRTVVDSGKSEAVFPGIAMIAFDLSPDGKQVVYATAAPGGTTQLWLAALDRSVPASKVGAPGGRWPRFGPRDQIFFEETEGNANYLEQMNADGSNRSKVVPYPIAEFQGVSPGHRWVMVAVPRTPERDVPAVLAVPLDGGPARHMCASYCSPRWSTDGKFLFIPVEDPSWTSPGRSLAIPVGPGERLPDFPAGGIAPLAEASVVPGAQSVGRGDAVPGKDAEHYAWVNVTVHRNLYRISLP